MCRSATKTSSHFLSASSNSLFNLLLTSFLLCPFVGTSAFLAPPPKMGNSVEGINGQAAAEKVHLLDGQLLLKLSDVVVAKEEKSSTATAEEEEEEQVCAKALHRNATLLHSISKSTGARVHLRPHTSQFTVRFCAQPSEGQQCALGMANCATVYRWTRALVRHQPHPRGATYVADKVLIPVDCLCVLGWSEKFGRKGPIVLE